MFLALFVILLLIWLGGFLVYHVATGLIHLVLMLAIIFLILDLFRRRHSPA